MDLINEPVFSWTPDKGIDHLRYAEFLVNRLAYTLMTEEIKGESGIIQMEGNAARIEHRFVLVGVPIRNQVNRLEIDGSAGNIVIALRCAEAFGEVLIDLNLSDGKATAYSITINRIMKGGVSHSSPRPEEQMIQRIGQFTFAAFDSNKNYNLVVTAIEEKVTINVNGDDIVTFVDPDIAAGCLGLGTTGWMRLTAIEQIELITPEEQTYRQEFLRRMNAFAAELDAEYETDIARRNELSVEGERLVWTFPNTGARMILQATEGSLTGTMNAGLYGDAGLLNGDFALPQITTPTGEVYRLAPAGKPQLEGDDTHLRIILPLQSEAGKTATMTVKAAFTENPTWFWTAEVEGIVVANATLAFGLEPSFEPNNKPSNYTTQLLITDDRVGHYWQNISGQETKIGRQIQDGGPALVVRSKRPRFRWATLWLPMQKLNLTGYQKRMLHFIRYPETPVQEWRDQPSKHEYPTDEELLRYARHGVDAMVWHHTWTSNNYRKREGFIVNQTEMRRAMKKSHELGMDVITYIGIVPGRHPVLRYEDLAGAFYDKNWDLQDFTFYAVAGRWSAFLPYMTDYWCREYGLDGYYADGGLANVCWGLTQLTEDKVRGLSLEELNDRLYSRVKRVLRRHNAGFGLENWGGSPINLISPFYDCRMIGENFQEASPENYRDAFNPLLTGTPFKMYGMDLTARNRYNIAMAAVCLADIQICSGNRAWGNWPDRPSDWANLSPFWQILDSIDWDNLLDARPWWAQELLEGEGFYAGYYITPGRTVFFLANRTQKKHTVAAKIKGDILPETLRNGRCRQIYPEHGEFFRLGQNPLVVHLPRLVDGPVGFEIVE